MTADVDDAAAADDDAADGEDIFRRLPTVGRGALVPLGSGKERKPLNAFAVPDYEITISSTFRSVGTIPEVGFMQLTEVG